MCVLFCENANYNFADFPLGFLLGRLCGGLFVIYVFLVFYLNILQENFYGETERN